MGLAQTAAAQAEDELPILKLLGADFFFRQELIVLNSYSLSDISTDPDSDLYTRLNNLFNLSPELPYTEALQIFRTKVLGENAQLLFIRIDEETKLGIGVHDPVSNMQLVLPIQTISFFRETEDLGLNNLTITTTQVKIDFGKIIFGYTGTYYSGVDPAIHYGVKAELRTTDFKHGDVIETTEMPSRNTFIDRKEFGFILGLPISPANVIAQLHELGHYIANTLAGNNAHTDIHLTLALALNYDTGKHPLFEETARLLRNLKQMEVLAWVYAQEFLRRIGNSFNLLGSGPFTSSLTTYDYLLAYPLLLAGDKLGNIEDYFIFPDTLTRIQGLVGAYENLRVSLETLLNSHSDTKSMRKILIPNLEASVEITPESIKNLLIDDISVDVDINYLVEGGSSYITLVLTKNNVKQEFKLSLSSMSSLAQLGAEFLNSLAGSLTTLNTDITANPSSERP